MENINILISYLIAIKNYAKDIHYSCKGDSFYSKHLFADRIYDGLNDQIDHLKEVCLLGHNIEPLSSKQYLSRACEFIPDISYGNDNTNFRNLHKLLETVLNFIESITDISKGDENLIGAIAQDLQQNYGLLNQQIK